MPMKKALNYVNLYKYKKMTQTLVHVFPLLVLAAISCNGQTFDFTAEPENCLCSCGQSKCDLVGIVKQLDKRLIVASDKIMDLIKLKNTFESFQSANRVEHKEMWKIIEKLSKQLNSNENPTSESLILRPEAMISTPSPVMAEEASKMTENLTIFIKDKFEEVNNLSSEVTGLQQENKVLKEKIEEEKRVRRSLQHHVYFVEERLNQTQSWVLEINEKVSDKDSENSTVDEVAEMVFAKIAEFDVLKKTDIENQLKKLEYTVQDAFRNETQLAQRLDSVENASAYTVGLLGNGTLVDKVHNIASTIQILENVQSQQSDLMSQLEHQVSDVNSSLKRKLIEVEYTISIIDLSLNETMLSFEGELSKMNDTWREKSVFIDQAFVTIDEKISESTNLTAIALNTTKDAEAFFKALYSETLGNITAVQNEMAKAQIQLQELIQIPDELISVKSILNQTVDRNELHDLWNNVIKQSTLLEEKAFAFYTNLSGIINNTEEKITDMDSKYSKENDLMKHNLSVLQKDAKTQLDTLLVEFQNLILNQTEIFSLLQSRLKNLSSKVEATDQENEFALSAIVYNISKLHDLQQEKERKMLSSFHVMEQLLLTKIDVHKEEFTNLINNLEATINSTIQKEVVVTDSEGSFPSRAKMDLSEITTQATTEAPIPCLWDSLTTSSEVVIAHHRNSVYEEILEETFIPNGEHLFFSCKKIGKYILIGAQILTCVNGKWDNQFPQCEKLLDESVIRGKVDELQDIIPPIDFAPFGVDVANSLLSTSITGELVVYPGVSLKLICLYPRKLGEPRWDIVEEVSHPHIQAWDVKGISDVKDAYKLKLDISTITKDSSGNYTCITPRGRSHTIRLLVKDVRCPAFVVNPGSHVSVTYRLNPEGLQRVITTQASFDCSRGYSINGSSSAICRGSGHWSHDLPTCQKEEIIGCLKPDLHTRPELHVDPFKTVYSAGDKIYFKCSGKSLPIGITTARCNNHGIWTVFNGPLTETDLPTCE